MGIKTVSCENSPLLQNRSTNVHNMETWQKRKTFFTEPFPVAASILHLGARAKTAFENLKKNYTKK